MGGGFGTIKALLMNTPRVVITGIGTVNPVGHTIAEFWEGLKAGRSGITRWKSIDLTGVDCTVGGDLGDYDFKAASAFLREYLPADKASKIKRAFRTCTPSNRLTTISSCEAFRDAKLLENHPDPFRTSMVVAGHNLNHQYILDNNLRYRSDPTQVDIFAGIEALDTTTAATISEILYTRGPISTVGGACASGLIALRSGYRDIILGECDRAIIAGASYDITASDIYAMTNVNAVVTDPSIQEDPTHASRPFDVRRGGFIPSHGAGTIILERLESALERGAPIYGEVLSVAVNSDASSYPTPSSDGQAKVMELALKTAGKKPEDIDYINCHATSTKLGDIEEIRAIGKVFGEHRKALKLNASKSILGHLTWSSAVVELIGALLQMKHNLLHPSINVETIDPEIDVDVCANHAQPHTVNCFMKNAFGFGGINSSIIVARYDG